ncbi:N-acetylmuramoyl-L-alanine amidase [Paenactinomyces guangxiensis]|uniref:N-acetylmuramoyl-L-alanine amidase n=1 Tax=Paenactinomyces guangxiensis TaxID=1490290 RepID=A0A7W1WRN2_9BACL|nr:N-acetylmuramoyl-L-alanine amidase [Paenactinomyces guangxiensis]MBA4494813.1 N-acetylmuramoyl-L-alanine amidase [Paenactinomyces guangxiensis]MBH8591896.1 N-acetylmuramoyl-L-alanine amidase [Paenactinomyces guangxiensis]
MPTVVIDPGHGGNDAGAVNGSYQEKNFTLEISRKVRDYLLDHYKVNILMTRTTDQTVSLQQRTDFANSNHADYFCSIHINAGGGTGWESYIFNGTVPQATIRAQQIIHQTVMDVIGKKYGVRDRGKKRANFHVLRETEMSAILLENLFIDTSEDLKLLNNSTFIHDLAVSIGEGIAKALSLEKKTRTLYKVIAGSFKNRQNAEDRKSFLATKGIDSIIVKVSLNGEDWYRVQSGAFRERANAEARLEEVKWAGISDAYILEDETPQG